MRKQFDRIYRDLFLNWEISPDAPAFVKRAFLDFMMNHWGHGIVAPSLLTDVRSGLSKRFLTKTELAHYLGVTMNTVTKMIKQQKLPHRLMKAGKREYCLFDRERLGVPKKHDGKVYSLPDAARMLGLPVNTLRELKKMAVYVSNHLSRRNGFHELDLRAFKEKLLGLSPQKDVLGPTLNSEAFTTLSKVLRSHTAPGGGAVLICALLEKHLPVIGNSNSTISGLMISKREYKAFANDNRARFAGNARTPAEAAEELHCDPETIAGLVNQGFLQGQQKPKGLRVTETSLSTFKQKFVSVASLAQQIQSSSRGVLGYCEANGIPILYVQTKRRWKVQGFLQVEDTHRLRGFRVRAGRRRNEALIRLPMSLLRSLDQSGHFEVKHPRRRRFHHADVIAFTNKLFDLVPETPVVPLETCITLQNAMQERYGSREGKANLIRAVLSGELPIVGKKTTAIGGLLIPRAKFREFFKKQVESVVPSTGTSSLAGHNIGCDRRFIPGLIELGLLEGKRVGTVLQISEESIVGFKKAYLPVADIAKRLGTSSSRLIRHCRQHKIRLLTVQSRMDSHPATSFIHTEDQKLVLSSFPTKPQSVGSAIDESVLPKDQFEAANSVLLSETVPAPALN